jgi:hypothetical protein
MNRINLSKILKNAWEKCEWDWEVFADILLENFLITYWLKLKY